MTGEAILARSCVERQAGAEDHLIIGSLLHGNALCDIAIQSRTLKVALPSADGCVVQKDETPDHW